MNPTLCKVGDINREKNIISSCIRQQNGLYILSELYSKNKKNYKEILNFIQ